MCLFCSKRKKEKQKFKKRSGLRLQSPDGPSLAPKHLTVTVMVSRVFLTAVPTYKEKCQTSLLAVRKNVSRINPFPPDVKLVEDTCLHIFSYRLAILRHFVLGRRGVKT